MDAGAAVAADVDGLPVDAPAADAPADASADLVLLPEGPEDSLPGSTPARLTITPGEATLTARVGCAPAEVTFRITNAGGSPTGSLSPLSLAGPFGVDWEACAIKGLAPGESCEIKVRFQAATPGEQAGTLLVRADPGGEVTAELKGIALVADALALTPNNVDFGSLMVGDTSPVVSLRLQNAGVTPLAIAAATLSSADFSVKQDGCAGKTLLTHATCLVQVVFEPASSGAKAARLSLGAQGCGGGPARALLQGAATARGPTVLEPMVLLAEPGSESVAYRYPIVNMSATTTPGPLAAEIRGSEAARFRIQDSECSGFMTGLLPGQLCAVHVVFRPAAVGDVTAQLFLRAPAGDVFRVDMVGSAGCGNLVIPWPFAADFSTVSVSSPPATPPVRTINLANARCSPVGPVSVSLSGVHATDFRITSNECEGKTVQSRKECPVTVSFVPTTMGARSASLQFKIDPTRVISAPLAGFGN